MTPKLTPETLRELASRQTYGEPDGPQLRANMYAHVDAWEADILHAQTNAETLEIFQEAARDRERYLQRELALARAGR